MFNYYLALLALGGCLQVALATDALTRIVQLKHGKVNGKFIQAENGVKMEFFEGIKYGQAGRFEKPRAVHPWTYVYPATSPRAACPQFGGLPPAEMLNMSEDCLYLNLWRPTEEKKNRTVMVFIHGGAFEAGTAFTDTLDGRYLAHAGDLIVVSINYRLGPLGFLNGPGIPANLGLHDQIFALKWVQENIGAFGGNPDDVTIFGESAGSMSVGALVLSPLAKGLFHRAILQSGGPLGVTVASATAGIEKVKALALRASCQVNSTATLNETLTCLKGKSLTQLQVASAGDFPRGDNFFPTFGDAVLPLAPSVALQTGTFNDVDLLYGVNRDEGTVFAAFLVPDLLHNQTLTRLSAKRDIEVMLKKYNITGSIATEMADFYLSQIKSQHPSQDELKVAISNVWGDAVLVCPTILFGEELARHSHRRQFAYRLMQLTPTATWTGVTHGQDLAYLFMPQLLQGSPSLSGLSQQMIHAWLSFAKTGVPGSMGSGHVWEEAVNQKTADYNTRYMHLEADKYKMVGGAFKDTCERFWKAKLFA